MPLDMNNNTFDDDIDDEQLEPQVTMELGFAKVIVVDNVPVVPQEKYEKLKSVLQKVFTSVGHVKQLSLPQDSKGVTKGYCFVEYNTQEEAETAIAKTNEYKLDKTHIFKVTHYDDFQKYSTVSDEYRAPEVKPYEPRENLRTWLLDPREIDQYVIRYGNWTEVLWNDLKQGEEPEVVVKRENWSDTFVAWSPRGTYLLTVHAKGVAIWGGAKWDKLMRFMHPGVKLVEFSPCERYLVTASPQYQENDNPKDPQCIIVWDVRSGRKLRGFLGGHTNTWPVFKWSFDGKYLARVSEDAISVYETPSMDLLDKKSLKIPGVKDFSWSPTEHLISYYVPGANNRPASVVLVDLPSRKERRQKSLFDVTDCKMHWHPNGSFLCVKTDRQKKKSTVTNFELFRIKERNIPTELLEMKDTIIAFAWEPQGTRFAVVHGEIPRPDVSFYSMEKQVKLLKTLEKKPVNHLFWSPQGSYIVLAGLHNLNGTLEFFNVNDMESMATEEHYMASVVDWDPTGRFVTTTVSFWRHQLENGYNIYSFNGKLQRKVLKDKFYQLLWRPHPPTLLSEDQVKNIKKNIHKVAKEYKDEDNARKKAERDARKQKRYAMRKDFEDYLAERRKEFQSETQTLNKLRGAEDDDENIEYREEWVEEVVDFQEIILED